MVGCVSKCAHVEMICCKIFFFKEKTALEISACLVGSEMCIRDSGFLALVSTRRSLQVTK